MRFRVWASAGSGRVAGGTRIRPLVQLIVMAEFEYRGSLFLFDSAAALGHPDRVVVAVP